jgi:hypothetical protein
LLLVMIVTVGVLVTSSKVVGLGLVAVLFIETLIVVGGSSCRA